MIYTYEIILLTLGAYLIFKLLNLIYDRRTPISKSIEMILASIITEPDKWKRVDHSEYKNIDNGIRISINYGYAADDWPKAVVSAPSERRTNESISLSYKEHRLIKRKVRILDRLWDEAEERRKNKQLIKALGEKDEIIQDYLTR